MDNFESTNYAIHYRNIKYPRLEFKTGTLQLILPKQYKNHQQLLEKHKKWIRKKQNTIQNALQESKTRKLDQTRTVKQLKTIIYAYVQQYQEELDTKINKTIYRKMKTKWASYSKNRNLTINTLLRYLPQNLVKYIIYHELTHSKERKHNEKFWNIIQDKFHDYTAIEKDLLIYWFLVQDILNH